MAKFKNLKTGLIEETDNKFVIKQMSKYPDTYEAVKSSDKGPTLDELKAVAEEKGIEVPKKVSKAELIALIEAFDNDKKTDE